MLIINIIVLFVIVGYYFFLAFGTQNKGISYNSILINSLFIEISILIFVVVLSIMENIDCNNYKDGILIPEENHHLLYYYFIIPLINYLLSWLKILPKRSIINEIKFPLVLIPKTNRELLLFGLFIIFGVIFEELVMRYYLFHYLNKILGLQGDFLIVVATIIFALGHLYQNTRGLLLAILGNLLLSKIYLITDSIITTIILHLLMNLNIIFEVMQNKTQMTKT